MTAKATTRTPRSSALPRYLLRCGARVERGLRRELKRRRRRDVPADLVRAMEYSLLAPAKRVRPAIVFAMCEAAGGGPADALLAAMAIECVHTYSLIHDDLPCMDDDDMRRGRPSSHKAFGEAMAVLAGDALQTLAFELTASAPRGAALTAVLAEAAGAAGMVGGQVLDLQPRARSIPDVERVHACKTAALFAASAKLGAIAGGAAPAFVERAGEFGLHLGHAFQCADDLLDHRAGEKDGVSLAALCGPSFTRARANFHAEAARRALPARGAIRDVLERLAAFVVERTV